MIRMLPPAYFTIVPNRDKVFEIFPNPIPNPTIAAASGNPYPNAKEVSIINPQTAPPFIKEAASMTGKIGLQHEFKVVDNTQMSRPKRIAEKMPRWV